MTIPPVGSTVWMRPDPKLGIKPVRAVVAELELDRGTGHTLVRLRFDDARYNREQWSTEQGKGHEASWSRSGLRTLRDDAFRAACVHVGAEGPRGIA